MFSSSPSDAAPSPSPGAFECNICLETAAEPVITFCGHLYCWACLFRWMRGGQSTCPVCKSGISRETVIPLYGRGDDSRVRSGAAGTAAAAASRAASDAASADMPGGAAGGGAGGGSGAHSSGGLGGAGVGAAGGAGSAAAEVAAAAAAASSAAAAGDAIPGRPHAQRTSAEAAAAANAGGARQRGPRVGGGAADPHGFFGPGQRVNNPWDPYGPQGANNFAFTAGFGFFPSLFGLQFQTFGLGGGGVAAHGGDGDGAARAPSPEELHQLLLSRVLLALGCLVMFMLLFL